MQLTGGDQHGAGDPRPQAHRSGDRPGQGPGQPGQAGAGGQGASPRGTGKPRPGKHAASKPGGSPGSEGSGGAAAVDAPGTGAGGAGTGAGTGGTGAGPRRLPGPTVGRRPRPRAGAGGTPRRRTSAEQLAERTADLQRLQAEYANYRKRVERDRVAVREQALANVLAGLLPVLDDIGRAREHGELTGGFKSVADSLEAGAPPSWA